MKLKNLMQKMLKIKDNIDWDKNHKIFILLKLKFILIFIVNNWYNTKSKKMKNIILKYHTNEIKQIIFNKNKTFINLQALLFNEKMIFLKMYIFKEHFSQNRKSNNKKLIIN